MNILAKLENMPLTYTVSEGWELFDELTGEIFPVETERGGIMLRNMAIRHDDLIWKFARVRSNDYNAPQYFPFHCHICNRPLTEDEYNICAVCSVCKCCGATLQEIDPKDICMDCVDIGCNVKDD